jgi:uncharacterized repeat protein (TIGR01451 family)
MAAAVVLACTACAAQAQQLKISQIYAGGGNAGAVYNRDYVELFNASGVPVNTAGWSVQLTTSGTATAWNVVALPSVVIPPGGYFLIQLTLTGTNGAALPTPDLTVGTAINPLTAGAKVALVSNTTQLTGACPSGLHIMDFIGYGNANCFEGPGPAPAAANATASLRLLGGCQDTNDNSVDVITTAPNPRNSSTVSPCARPPGADVQAFLTAQPAQISIGSDGEFGFTVLNNGPDAAPGAALTIPLPGNAAFVSSTPAGSVVGTDVVVPLGNMAAGTGVNVSVRLAPLSGTSVAVNATAGSAETDGVPGNNTAAASALVFDSTRANLFAGIRASDQSLRAIDVESGASVTLLTLPVSGLAADNENRRFFVSTGTDLVIIPWDTMTPQTIGAFSGNITDILGLAWDPTRQKLFATTNPNLYEVDTQTAVTFRRRLFGGGSFVGLDYDITTDRLIATNNSTSTANGLMGRGFYTIDPDSVDGDPAPAHFLAYPDRIPGTPETDIDGCAVGGGRIYGVTDQEQWVYRYDRSSMMFLSPLAQSISGDGSEGGAAWAPEFFNQTPGVNLGVAVDAPANCAVLDGETIVFTARVRNFGTATATGVGLQVTLPAGMTFVSSVPALTPVGNTVTLNAGTLNPGASASVAVTAALSNQTNYAVHAAASGAEPDVLPLNDSTTRLIRTLALPPAAVKARAVLSTHDGFNDVPGLPGVKFSSTEDLGRSFRSLSGSHWVMRADTDAPTAQDQVIVRGSGLSYEVVAREGVTVLPNGELATTFSNVSAVRDGGDFAFITDWAPTDVNVGQTAVKSIGGVLSLVATQGTFVEALLPLGDIPYFAARGSLTMQSDGTLSFFSNLTSPAPAGTQNIVLSSDGAVKLARSGIDFPGMQLALAQSYNTMANGNADGLGSWVSADGTRWSTRGTLNGPTATDTVLVVDGDVVIQEGFPIPGSSLTANVSSIAANYMEPHGDVFAYGALAGGQDFVWRNGQVIAATGDEIFPGAGEFYSDARFGATFFAATGNCTGDWVVGGVTDAADSLADAVIVLNGQRVVVREGDAIDLDGDGDADERVYVHIFINNFCWLSNDGWLYFTVRTRDAAQVCSRMPSESGQALIRVRAFCPGDYNRDGVTAVPDIFAFLSDWFAGVPKADMNCSGTLDVPDIFEFLTAWFTPCSI